ncbi:hypothetical protein [Streptomyces violascens]|uniref:hypothetical protein n=1 Tax=Streptomyces violascens TaxID=67381 RepID=UPI0036C12DC5
MPGTELHRTLRTAYGTVRAVGPVLDASVLVPPALHERINAANGRPGIDFTSATVLEENEARDRLRED